MGVGEARRRLDDLYRLLPDQRFLLALGEVERLLNGRERVALRASFAEGVWKISTGDEIIGTLPRYPTFEDGFASVLARTREVLADQPPARPVSDENLQPIRDRVTRFWPADLIASLQELGPWWRGVPTAEVSRLAATAYLWLNIQTINGFEMADPLEGRALALQAIATATGSDDLGDRALLAWLLGYTADAKALAARVSPESPLGHFVSGNHEALLRTARGGSPVARYVALLALSNVEREEQWEEWLQTQFSPGEFSPSILRAARGLNRFETQVDWAWALLRAATEGVAGKTAPAQPEYAPSSGGLIERLVEHIVANATAVASQKKGLFGDFERDLDRHCGAASTPTLWDRSACQAYWRAHFYGGLSALGSHFLDDLSSGPAALSFAERLRDPPASGPAAQFTRWYGDLASVRAGTPPSDRELDDLEAIPDLGGTAASRLFATTPVIFQWKTFLASEAVHRLSRNLDSRPAHQTILLSAFAFPLLDGLRVERTCRNAAFRAGENAQWSAWCSNFVGDTAQTLRNVRRKDFPLDQRVYALSMSRNLLPAAEIRAEYRKLLEETGYARTVTYSYLLYLDSLDPNGREMESVARGWLSHHPSEQGSLTHAVYSARVAWARSEQGKHEEAWSLIEPLIETGQGAIMNWAALILQRLGRPEEAMHLARAIVDRYPEDLNFRASLAYLLWRNGRYSEAAVVLNPPAHPINTQGWDLLGRKLRDALVGKDDQDALQAIEAVRRGNRSLVLDYFLQPIAQERPDLAFTIYSKIEAATHEFAFTRLAAYRFLRERKGEEEATSWLRGQLANGTRDMVAPFFFEREGYATLWGPLDPPAGAPPLSSTTWMLRAAGALLEPLSDPLRQRLAEHFAAARPSDFHHALGRFLLGMESPDALDRLARTPQDKADLSACHGLLALAARDFEDASEWFQLTVLLGDSNFALPNFSYAQLVRWSTANRALRLQAAKGHAARRKSVTGTPASF